MTCARRQVPNLSRSVVMVVGLSWFTLASGGDALAFEDETHAGMTAEAALRSRLHEALRAMGLELGLFEKLAILPSATSPREYHQLRLQLSRVDPTGGYFTEELRQWAIGWLMAGAVLQQHDRTNDRHHFLDPTTGGGLSDAKPPLGALLGLAATIDGPDTFRQLLTGTAFSLTGLPASAWIRDARNPHDLAELASWLARALTEKTAPLRAHALARALLSLGGLLHVLQDMAVPAHTRNDYVEGHLQRLGGSPFDRGSGFERFVQLSFGSRALPAPRHRVAPRARIQDYFSNATWTGLADLTHAHHFSPGTLPPPLEIGPLATAVDVERRASARMRYKRPAVHGIDLGCAREGRVCYLRRREHAGPLLAYRMDRTGRLTFALDRRCLADSAARLVPLAIAFTSALIDHLLRGKLEPSWERDGQAIVRNAGPSLLRHSVRLVALRGSDREQLLLRHGGRLAAGATIGPFAVEVPPDSDAVWAVIAGVDENDDPVLAHAPLSQ